VPSGTVHLVAPVSASRATAVVGSPGSRVVPATVRPSVTGPAGRILVVQVPAAPAGGPPGGLPSTEDDALVVPVTTVVRGLAQGCWMKSFSRPA